MGSNSLMNIRKGEIFFMFRKLYVQQWIIWTKEQLVKFHGRNKTHTHTRILKHRMKLNDFSDHSKILNCFRSKWISKTKMSSVRLFGCFGVQYLSQLILTRLVLLVKRIFLSFVCYVSVSVSGSGSGYAMSNGIPTCIQMHILSFFCALWLTAPIASAKITQPNVSLDSQS